MDWFQEIYPKVKRDLPAPIKPKLNKTYEIIFKEESPRIVGGGYGRKTAVIDIEYNGKPFSLYLSHVDLARQISIIQQRRGTLQDLTIRLTKKRRTGKKNYNYEIIELAS